MVRPAYGKNGGVFVDILSRVTISDYYKILLVLKYVKELYEYAYYYMYKTYRLLHKSEQKKYMTANIKDRDDDIINYFNRTFYNYKDYMVKNVPVLANSTIYKETIYITPDMIQGWIKRRIIWYAGMDCYRMMPEFDRWKHRANVTPDTLRKKLYVYMHLENTNYRGRTFMPTEKTAYIPQMQMKSDEIRKYINHTTPSVADIDQFNDRPYFRPYNIGRYNMPVVGAELVAYLKYDVNELWRYLYQCDYKLYHINIKPYVDPAYIKYCVPNTVREYDYVDIEQENQLVRFVMLNMHLIPKNKNSNMQTLMYHPSKMRELEDRYLEQKGIEYNEFDKTLPGYYG